MAKSKKSVWAIVGGIVGLVAVVGATFGIVTAVKQAKCEHVWNDGEVKVEATCAKEGKIMFKCDDCGKIEIEKIEKLPHVWKDEDVKLPTCDENGHTEYTVCEGCGEYKNGIEPQILLALGHTEEVIEGRAATCTGAGLTVGKYCTTCNEMTVEQRVIAAKGHNVVQVAAKAATCTEPGETAGQKCSNCDLVYSGIAEIPATGHKDENQDGKCDTCKDALSPTVYMKEVALETSMDLCANKYIRVYKPSSGHVFFDTYSNKEGYTLNFMPGSTNYVDNMLSVLYITDDGIFLCDDLGETVEGLIVNETDKYFDLYLGAGDYDIVSVRTGAKAREVAIIEGIRLDVGSEKDPIYFLEEK